MQTFLNALAWVLFVLGAGVACGIMAGLLGPEFAAMGLLSVGLGFSALAWR